LPCYKRHQQWAQCSGERDPTVYVRKSKLATPAGVDHDYNFIAGIERAFDGAERRLEESGLQANNSTGKAQKRENALRQAVSRSEIIVEKAPLGMTRQKQNRTHWLPRYVSSHFYPSQKIDPSIRSKCIEWTVEWIHEDNSSHIDQVKDDTPLWQAHFWLVRRRTRESRKRKRDSAQVRESDEGEFENAFGDPAPNPEQPEVDEKAALIATSSPEIQLEEPNLSQPESKEEQVNDERTSQILLEESLDHLSSATREVVAEAKPGTPDSAGNHYYLVKPRTGTPQKVLIPLSPLDTLSKCLHRQVILEFPSIKVLSKPPLELPSDCILEKDYLGKFKTEPMDIKHEGVKSQITTNEVKTEA